MPERMAPGLDEVEDALRRWAVGGLLAPLPLLPLASGRPARAGDLADAAADDDDDDIGAQRSWLKEWVGVRRDCKPRCARGRGA